MIEFEVTFPNKEEAEKAIRNGTLKDVEFEIAGQCVEPSVFRFNGVIVNQKEEKHD